MKNLLIAAGTKRFSQLAILFIGMAWSTAVRVYAAGGGENLLLVVNPSDEPSLRIANAYVKARNIPVNNLLYIDPTGGKGATLAISSSSFTTLYQTPILNAIAARGLTSQIDYIGTLGQPHIVTGTSPSNYVVSFHDCLNHLTQLQNGMTLDQVISRKSELLQNPPPSLGDLSYTAGSNTAIYHSRQWTPTGATGTASYAQWYMTGMIGYSGVRGLTTTQAIQNLQRTVRGDGAKPAGTIYFEDSQELRTTARSPYWPPVQAYLDKIGVPWIQEKSITPRNRADVRGAVVGSASPTLATQIVNGSAYLPGSWADDLTSFAGSYSDTSQTKVSHLLLAGAAGAAGTVNEPNATQSRFTYASVFLFSNDGSTLGEAYYKSVEQPDLLMFQGDLLSQAYADIPEVIFTAGPAEGSTVSGTISVTGSARLNSPRVATGIAQVKLFLDGLQAGSAVSGAAGSFSLDTTTLADGLHEVRLVAYNNSLAASEGYALKNLVVNNRGQSVGITGAGTYNVAWNQTLAIPVTSTQGSGPTITGIQLQSLGRVVGSISGLSGSVSLDVTKLAYGSNPITPVALLSSGTQQVQGTPITVTRQFQQFPGTVPTPLGRRIPGCDFSFFGNAVGSTSTLDTINFNATPSETLHSTTMNISPDSTYSPGLRNMPETYHVGSYYANKLAIMIKSNFTVATAGEYWFIPSSGAYTSCGILVDGLMVSRRDKWNTTTATHDIVVPSQAIYLRPGEHTLTVKLGQSRSGRNAYETTFSLVILGTDGNTVGTGAPNFYTVNPP